MTRPLLHDYFRSSAAYRVRIALNLKGIAYDRHSVNLATGAQKQADYRALNPQGFVPMLEIDDLKLTQSLAIAVYLDQKFPDPPLMPRDPADGAHVRALAMTVACDIHPLNNLRVLKYLKGTLGVDAGAERRLVRSLGDRGPGRAGGAGGPARGRVPVRGRADLGRRLPRPPALQCAAVRGADRALSLAPPRRRIGQRPSGLCRRSPRCHRSAGRRRMNRVDTMNRGIDAGAQISELAIPPMKDRVSAEEWSIRVDLAAAYRLIAHYGWDDLIFTHLSARIPGDEHHFLLNPYQLMFEEVTASSLVKVDVHGHPVDPTPFITNPAGFIIHSAIHMAREDAHAVMHLHTPHGQAVAAHEDGLLPLTQTAMLVRGDLAFHDYEGVATEMEERERLVEDLGDKERHAAPQPRHPRCRGQRRRMLRQTLFP